VIARHPRSYEREDFVFDRCTTWRCSNARSALSTRRRRWSAGTCRGIRHAAPPDRGPHGQTRQTRVRPGAAAAGVFRPEDVVAGVREAIARGVIGFDAGQHLVLCRIERRPPQLDLTVYLSAAGYRAMTSASLSRPSDRASS